MNRHYDVTAVSSDRAALSKVAEKYGINHHHIEMTRQITPLKDLKSLWKVYRFLKKHKPEIVHTHTPKAGLIGM
ncbi:MAG TPA: glycosyltransferase family 1 protein, partial [Chryseobacterium sp.]|nr:glycosyltransferase family 1 protein [Chryseobacterium sp.]